MLHHASHTILRESILIKQPMGVHHRALLDEVAEDADVAAGLDLK
jgi:hypothetical protein